jgi:hypothetical protein
MYHNLVIGADPELFLKDKQTGSFFPAIGLIGGTKEEPRPLDQPGYALQEDNVMVEFNIPPAKTAFEMQQSIQHVLDVIRDEIPDNLEMAIVPSAVFEPHLLEHPQAVRFGCDPDYNAWTISMNESPDSRTTLRTSGGHLHFGYDDPTMEQSVALIRAADLFLGVPSILIDTDKERRKMYGKAGACRPKPYGIEYRTLSNFWIARPELVQWAFDNAHRAARWLADGNTITEQVGEVIQKCINASDEGLAKTLCADFGVSLV